MYFSCLMTLFAINNLKIIRSKCTIENRSKIQTKKIIIINKNKNQKSKSIVNRNRLPKLQIIFAESCALAYDKKSSSKKNTFPHFSWFQGLAFRCFFLLGHALKSLALSLYSLSKLDRFLVYYSCRYATRHKFGSVSFFFGSSFYKRMRIEPANRL